MTKLSSIKFQKFDDFKNPVFICSPREESENYYTLEKIANNITKKHPTIFSPVYHSQEHLYCSIRFMKNSDFKKPEPHCLYDIEFKIMKKQKDDKTYLNCIINKLTFVGRIEYDEGTEVYFD